MQKPQRVEKSQKEFPKLERRWFGRKGHTLSLRRWTRALLWAVTRHNTVNWRWDGGGHIDGQVAVEGLVDSREKHENYLRFDADLKDSQKQHRRLFNRKMVSIRTCADDSLVFLRNENDVEKFFRSNFATAASFRLLSSEHTFSTKRIFFKALFIEWQP